MSSVAEMYHRVRQKVAEYEKELVLREGGERFRISIETLLDAFGIASAVRDESGKIIGFHAEYVNVAARAMFGLQWDQFVGKRFDDLFMAVRSNGLFDAWVRIVETGEPFTVDDLLLEDTFA